MAEYMYGFAQSGNGYKPALMRALCGADWAACGRPTIADLSMCGDLLWPEEFGVSWSDYPAIAAWLARFRAQPGWVHPYQLLPGHPLPAKSA